MLRPRALRVVLPVPLTLALTLTGLACGTSVTETAPTSAAASETGGATGEAAPVAVAPKIGSDEPEFEFGTVAPGKSVTHTFTVVNRGNADLHIERVERT